MKIITKELGPDRWTAFIDGDMMPYPARAETEAEALRLLKVGLKRRLKQRQAECEDIRKALSVLFSKST